MLLEIDERLQCAPWVIESWFELRADDEHRSLPSATQDVLRARWDGKDSTRTRASMATMASHCCTYVESPHAREPPERIVSYVSPTRLSMALECLRGMRVGMYESTIFSMMSVSMCNLLAVAAAAFKTTAIAPRVRDAVYVHGLSLPTLATRQGLSNI